MIWTECDAHDWRAAATQRGPREGIEAALRALESSPLNATTVILRDEALSHLDELPRGPLFGVPVVVKEEVDVAGCVTTFGTRGNVTPAAADAEIVRRLRAAGAVVVAKTTMPAFGAFPFTESEATGITFNPHDLSRTPGGSSGGTAALVAAGAVPVGIGGDGGGSIRIPAAHCGLVGLKPRRGVIPSAPHEDLWCDLGTAGALTRTARDARLMYDVLSDAPTAHPAQPTAQPTALRIAVDTTPLSPLTPPHRDHLRAVSQVAERLRDLGHEVVDKRITAPDPTPAFMVQFLAGIRAEIAALEFPERIERRHKHTKLMGCWVSSRVVDWAKRRSEQIGAAIEAHFDSVDLILTPTTSSRPARAGILSGKGTLAAQLASLSSVSYTGRYNVSGHPAIALPAGTGRDGLPLSVQLIASATSTERGEGLLFDVAAQLGH